MAAKMTDMSLFEQLGFDPKTSLPRKMVDGDPNCLKPNIKRFLRLIDEQDAINRYKWYNLPCNLTSAELERMLYYKGQLCFFYNEALDEFYFMPYVHDSDNGIGIDFYGRSNQVHPIPWYTGESESEKKSKKPQADYLSTLKLKPQYGIMLYEPDDKDLTTSCVLLHDYSKQIGQIITPRQQVNDAILDIEAECIPFMRTSLLLGTGITGVRVNDGDQAASVMEGAKSMEKAALSGRPWIAMTSPIEYQELTGGNLSKAEEYMLAMQSIDNFRLSGYGIKNGGLFEKKAHELESEAAINGGPVDLVYQDGLSIRQNFCNIVNSIWNLGIWCEASETQIGDINGNGVAYDDEQSVGTQDNGGTDDEHASMRGGN